MALKQKFFLSLGSLVVIVCGVWIGTSAYSQLDSVYVGVHNHIGANTPNRDSLD